MYSSISSDNGLAPARQQAIIWTNNGKFIDAYMRHLASMNQIILISVNVCAALLVNNPVIDISWKISPYSMYRFCWHHSWSYDPDLISTMKMPLLAIHYTGLMLNWMLSFFRNRGAIITVSSAASYMPTPQLTVYSATKVSVNSYFHSLLSNL